MNQVNRRHLIMAGLGAVFILPESAAAQRFVGRKVSPIFYSPAKAMPQQVARASTRRVSGLRSSADAVQTANRSLSVTSATARAQLRRRLGGPVNLGKGERWDAHHVLYLQKRNHPALKQVANGGYDINGPLNGLRIPAASTHRGVHTALQSANAKNLAQQEQFLNSLHALKASNATKAKIMSNQVRDWKYDIMKWDAPLMKKFNPEFPIYSYTSRSNSLPSPSTFKGPGQ